MSSQGSEEKALPASAHKLKKVRKKGQVVTSRDSLASLTTLIVLLYLFVRRQHLSDLLTNLFTYNYSPAVEYSEILLDSLNFCFHIVLQVCLPLIILVISLNILVGLLISNGPVFSTQPLMLTFNKINPTTGFTRIFGKRAFLVFLMHLMRVSVIFCTLLILLLYFSEALITSIYCGLECTKDAALGITKPLLAALIVVLQLSGILDYLVQRGAFLREQRMTLTEFKREQKDQYGDPHLKGRLKRNRHDMFEHPTGLAQATCIIYAIPYMAVAIRYVADEMPAPLVVARFYGAKSIKSALRSVKIRSAEDRNTVTLIANVPVGNYITEDSHITAIVPYLSVSGSFS